MKNYLMVFLICLLVGPYAQATDFYSNTTIGTGQQWDSVNVWDTPPAHTTVTMNGGSVSSMSTWNASTLSMSGGTVNLLGVNMLSTANVSGGSIGNLNLYATATVTLSGTAVITGSASVLGSAVFNMNDGTVHDLYATVGQGVINLRGGSIIADLSVKDLFVANIYGTSLVKTNSGGPSGFGRITGYWESGSAFAITLANPETYSHVNLVTIPEPVTLLLFAAGIPLLRRFRKHT